MARALPSAGAPGSPGADGADDFALTLATEGYVVIPRLVDARMVSKCVSAIRGRVRFLLRCYGVPCSPDCRELMEVGEELVRAPGGWKGAAFGVIDKRGWNRKVGNGRLFDDWENQAIDDVRELTRAHVARWHQCPPEALTAHPERCSVKVPGCLPLSAHLDQGRVGTIQV